jgi:hypothetical protein
MPQQQKKEQLPFPKEEKAKLLDATINIDRYWTRFFTAAGWVT